jgi:signal transduction histidine kinase/CheY-like chemotaxis protein
MVMLQRSFKRQIILAFVAGFSLLSGVFVTGLAWTERGYLYQESAQHAAGLAKSLAASARSWVLASDVAGLAEVVESFLNYPELRYAMVLSPEGRVLAHNEAARVGLFVADPTSLALLKSAPLPRTLRDEAGIVDVAVPILLEERHVGWARIGLGRAGIAAKLQTFLIIGALFVALAFTVSLLAALWLTGRLGRRVTALVRVAERVQAGDRAVRADAHGRDEFAQLGGSLNAMLAELEKHREHLEERVAERTAELEKEVAVRASTEAELLRAKEAAEAANRAKSIFLANMSHELRTPLNAILGFSSLMQQDPALSESQCRNLAIINKSGAHLLALINDVLDMSKIEAGRMRLDIADFDLGGMVWDIVDMMRGRAQEKGLQLLLDQSSAFPRFIRADEGKLRQVLINLLSNAVKFTETGGIALRLAAQPEPAVVRLLIEVEDSGIGISPEAQAAIFEPFVQAGRPAAQQGTGLGLAITRQFVEMMGGRIFLKSTPGQGSLFQVELPVQPGREAQVVPPPASLGEVIGLAPEQPAYRVLIVEDQLENRLLLSHLLQNVGFQVRLAENGAEGVAVFQEWLPHFIWMDQRMPVLDGAAATQRIRQLPGGQAVKIAAVTASVFEEQRQAILATGTDDVVRKPYKPEEIYNCMAKHLGVQYVYRQEAAPAGVDGALAPARLAALPADLRGELEQALIGLEEERIQAAIQRIALQDAPLARVLEQYAGSYNYTPLLRALQAGG